MTMKWKERISAAACFALFCCAFITSRDFPDIPKILPTGISVLGMLLCAMLFVRTFFARYADSGEAFTEEKKAGMIKVGLAIGMLTAYVLLIRVIGFYTISFVFMMIFSYVIDNEKQKLWTYPAVAAGLLVLVWAIFSLFLKVPLPKGILF